jgi:golgi to ER traffic protein 4
LYRRIPLEFYDQLLMSDSSLNLSKLFKRLEAARNENKFYEVLQIYKTIYFRCLKAKRYLEAFQYLYQGSELLHREAQWNDASDLVKLIVQLLRDHRVSVKTESASVMPYLKSIFSQMKPASIERSTFLSDILDVLQKDAPALLAEFHEHVGKQLWCEQRYSAARPHLLCSNNGQIIGYFLVEVHQQYGYSSEVDLFITQAVLQCLCMQKFAVATLAFCTYTRRHPHLLSDHIKSTIGISNAQEGQSQLVRHPLGPPFEAFPLLNFIWFLMLAIKKHLGLPVFHQLCEKYATSIERDPVYPTYLQKIAVLYFGLPPPAPPMSSSGLPANNMLMNLFRLFGDDENELLDAGDLDYPSMDIMMREIQEDDMD